MISVTKTHRLRIKLIAIFVFVFAMIAGLILFALKQNINLFYTPSELIAVSEPRKVRLGGMVVPGTIAYSQENTNIKFKVSDGTTELLVSYNGILPDLFREGQGIVSEGRLQGKIFVANEILAKHDESYMPNYERKKKI